MEHLLTLKSGLDELTKDECINIVACFKKKSIAKMLFQYFHLRLNQAASVSDLNDNIISKMHELNANITTIIASRENQIEQKSLEEYDDERNNLNFLPSLTIAAISSFLAFGDVINLEKCSKSIFIASRSAISLSSLPESYSSKLLNYLRDNEIKNASFYWDRFKNIKQVTLNISDFIRYDEKEVWLENLFQCEYPYKLNNLPFWSNLQELTIKGSDPVIEIGDAIGQTSPTRQLVNDLCNLPFDHLRKINFETYMHEPDMDRVLSNAKCLEYAISESFAQITSFSNKMKGYVITGDDHRIPLSSSIQSLHLPRYDDAADIELDLPSLKEICLHSPEQKELDWINKHALGCLERINCKLWDNFSLDEKLEQSLELLFGAPTVKYISISADKYLNEMIDILCNALEKSPKDAIKIRLFDDCDDQYSFSEMIPALEKLPKLIMKLLDVLQKETENFMLVGKVDIFKCESISSDIEAMKESYLVQSELEDADTHTSWSFVVSNKGCNINGYTEKWLLDCEFCEYRQIFKM